MGQHPLGLQGDLFTNDLAGGQSRIFLGQLMQIGLADPQFLGVIRAESLGEKILGHHFSKAADQGGASDCILLAVTRHNNTLYLDEKNHQVGADLEIPDIGIGLIFFFDSIEEGFDLISLAVDQDEVGGGFGIVEKIQILRQIKLGGGKEEEILTEFFLTPSTGLVICQKWI
jgi:hypothetical protein